MSPLGEDPESSDFAFIGAVHGLLQSARSPQKADLLLAAVLQALYESDRAFTEVGERVRQIWPGAAQSDSEVREALMLGLQLRLIAKADALDPESAIWTLTKSGAEDVRRHSGWVQDLRSRARTQVQERGQSGLLQQLSNEQAELILDQVIAGLSVLIRSSQSSYTGQVDALLNTGRPHQRLAPRNVDRAALQAALGDDEGPMAEFVQGLALSAIDPLDPFGNELVSHITTGCILHAFMAGVDRNKLIARVGSPVGQRAVLDTPVLIDLLGPRRLSDGLVATIRTAVGAGWEVVALEHSINEAQEVLHRDVPEIESDLRRAISEGAREAWYASLAEDQLPSLCVEVMAESKYTSLRGLLSAADTLSDFLGSLGVIVRDHGNEERSRVQSCYEALRDELADLDKGRSESVMWCDAETMEMVWRKRRGRNTGRWPGGWVVTKDRSMSAAFVRADHRAKVPLALRPSQWATLVAISVEPTDVETLARAAADQFIDEAAWTLPMRYPADVAMDLARQLGPEHGGSDTDLRVAQLTFDEAFTAPESSSIAASVLSGRANRLNSLTQASLDRWSEDLSEVKRRASEAELEAAEERTRRLEHSSRADGLASEKDGLTGENRWLKERNRRLRVAAVAGMASVALLTASIFLAGGLTLAITALGLLILGASLYRWCENEDAKVWPIVVGAVVDGVGLVSGLISVAQSSGL